MKLFCLGSPALSSLFYGFLAGIFYLGASAAPAQSSARSSDDAIIAVLHAQQEAWNRGDIEGFMNGYMRSDETIFVSGDELTRGWKTVHDRYRTKYSDRAKMGTLIFSDLQITELSSDAALASGRWQLKRANDNPRGRFTLILRNTPDGWRIVHDHTSEAR
jgi:ketosteroid isomerase-like protein